MLKNLIPLSSIIYILSCSALWANDDGGLSCDGSVTGYKLVEIDDLDELTQSYYKSNWGYNSPGKLTEDFNGDGVDDCAVLFTKPESDNDEVFLSIILNKDNVAEEVFFESVGAYKGIVFISAVKTGTELFTPGSLNAEEYIKLRHLGIRLTYAGKAEIVYFWSNEYQKIMTIQTAD